MPTISKALAAALFVMLPLAASAQVTAHKVKLTLKAVEQTINNSEELKPDKFTVGWKDIFDICEDAEPANDQGIFLFLDCEDLDNNLIATMDTDPVTLLQVIGAVDFDLAQLVQNTKNGAIQSATVPAVFTIECGDGAAAIEVFGIVDVQYKDLDGAQCPNSASAKILGTATDPSNVIVDNGSSLKAEKRTAAFSNQFPPE